MIQLYPDWYLAFCVVFVIVVSIVLLIVSIRHKP